MCILCDNLLMLKRDYNNNNKYATFINYQEIRKTMLSHYNL